MLRIHKLALGAAVATAVWAAALARPELTGAARTGVLLVSRNDDGVSSTGVKTAFVYAMARPLMGRRPPHAQRA